MLAEFDLVRFERNYAIVKPREESIRALLRVMGRDDFENYVAQLTSPEATMSGEAGITWSLHANRAGGAKKYLQFQLLGTKRFFQGVAGLRRALDELVGQPTTERGVEEHDYESRARPDVELPERPSNGPSVLTYAEHRLLDEFVAWLRAGGRVIKFFTMPGEAGRNETDAFIKDLDIHVEAKKAATRQKARDAVGQLHDYENSRASSGWLILVPEAFSLSTREYVAKVAARVGLPIRVVWRDGDGWAGDVRGLLA